MSRIKIVGFQDAATIETIFASSMVDVAYVDEVAGDAVYVTGDVGLDFDRPEDFAFVKDVIETTLADHGIRNLAITLAKPGE